jgi:phosphoserine phosphatase RsbU/P
VLTVLSIAEIVGAALGTTFAVLGLASIALAGLRSNKPDRSLIWFGTFTALYGIRLIARSDAVHSVLPFTPTVWDTLDTVITYIILTPLALLFWSIFGSEWPTLLRRLWQADLVYGIAATAWDLIRARSGEAMPLNAIAVVANVVPCSIAGLAALKRDGWSPEGTAVAVGLTLFTAVALAESIHGGLLGAIDLEPFAMFVLLIAIGYAVSSRVFRAERRLAIVGRELEMARRIQQSILPKRIPSVPGLRVGAHYEPMTEVAGDFYELVAMPDQQLAVLVADVSGHGVPAAIVAAMVKMALATQGDELGDPGLVLTRMNRALAGRFESAYVTATFAVIDGASRTMAYASAGHPPPLLSRSNGDVLPLDERGLVLGMLPDATYCTTRVDNLAVGDRLVFYTDGLTEAARADDEFFGDRALRAALANSQREPAERMALGLAASARRWANLGNASFADDVTLVVVSVEPS